LDANYTFPIRLGKGDAQGKRIHRSGTLKVAVQGICMVALAPNYRHNSLLAAIAVPFASLALSAAVAAFAVVAAVVAAAVAAAVAVPVHRQQLQSDQIGFVLLTSCQVELAALTAFQQEMMWKRMQRRY
jgi:urea transporter